MHQQLSPESNSIVKMKIKARQAKSNAETEGKKTSETEAPIQKNENTFQLSFELKTMVCAVGSPSLLLFNLYNLKKRSFMHENYYIEYSRNGIPTVDELLNNTHCLFKAGHSCFHKLGYNFSRL